LGAEIVKSLGTYSVREARRLAPSWEAHVGALFRRLRRDSRTMTDSDIDALVASYLNTELAEIDLRLAGDGWRSNGPDWRDIACDLLVDELENLEEKLAHNNLRSTLPTARAMLPGASEEDVRVLARRLLEAQHQARRAEIAGISGEPLPRPARAAVHAAVKPPEPASPFLSQMVADYVAFKMAGGKWTDKTRSQLVNLFRVQVDLVGDKPVRAITKEDMRQLYRLLPQMPAHATKRYPGMSAEEAIAAAAADSNDDRLSPKSQNDYFTHIKSLWKWSVENDYVDKSPAVVLKDVAETAAWDQRPAFADAQLTAYFQELQASATDDPAMLWVPRLMLYAGLRTEEAAKLTASDVREVEGVVCIDVNAREGHLKTQNAPRLVPVHSAIRKELLAYAASRPEGNLWGLVMNARGIFSLSKRLNDALDRACPEDDRLVTYSLRHTFATRLKYADVSDPVLDELLGHKVEQLSTGRYGKRYPVEKLQEAVERLRIDGDRETIGGTN
jgi:integrase